MRLIRQHHVKPMPEVHQPLNDCLHHPHLYGQQVIGSVIRINQPCLHTNPAQRLNRLPQQLNPMYQNQDPFALSRCPLSNHRHDGRFAPASRQHKQHPAMCPHRILNVGDGLGLVVSKYHCPLIVRSRCVALPAQRAASSPII